MNMTNKQIEQKAKEMGVSIEWYSDNSGVADAPVGKLFAATGTHALSLVHNDPFAEKGKKSEALKHLWEDLQAGFVDCDDADCENCHDNFITDLEEGLCDRPNCPVCGGK